MFFANNLTKVKEAELNDKLDYTVTQRSFTGPEVSCGARDRYR